MDNIHWASLYANKIDSISTSPLIARFFFTTAFHEPKDEQ
jgi:hypothetical protein